MKGIVLSKSLEESRKKALSVLERGQWPKYYFTKNGKGGIAKKTYLDAVGGRAPTNFWSFSETGHTDEAKKEMMSIFNGITTFDTPKPSRLIEFVLRISCDKNAIILDSFAGSGTTAHAVLNMYKQDGGNLSLIHISSEDPDSEEHIVKVKWIHTVNKQEAINETGFFCNQNIVCSSKNNRWDFTVSRLKELWNITD